jgi:hypothetical protein
VPPKIQNRQLKNLTVHESNDLYSLILNPILCMIKHDKIESKSSKKLKWINFDVLLGKFMLCMFFAEFFCKLQSRNDCLWFFKMGNGFLV